MAVSSCKFIIAQAVEFAEGRLTVPRLRNNFRSKQFFQIIYIITYFLLFVKYFFFLLYILSIIIGKFNTNEIYTNIFLIILPCMDKNIKFQYLLSFIGIFDESKKHANFFTNNYFISYFQRRHTEFYSYLLSIIYKKKFLKFINSKTDNFLLAILPLSIFQRRHTEYFIVDFVKYFFSISLLIKERRFPLFHFSKYLEIDFHKIFVFYFFTHKGEEK